MAKQLRLWFKQFLLRVGASLPAPTIVHLDLAINYLALGRWMRAKKHDIRKRFTRREELFDLVATQVGHRKVLYMEFGVFQGDATRYWTRLLHNPNSHLHGFDSFEGLPEHWLPGFQKGHFDMCGVMPWIDDERVKFFKGWFEETLPNYHFPPHDVLVINLDADLYSSTICVLRALKNKIVPGTYIYFDEFNQRAHEFRAFDEFINETGMKFSLLGVTGVLQHALFQRVA